MDPRGEPGGGGATTDAGGDAGDAGHVVGEALSIYVAAGGAASAANSGLDPSAPTTIDGLQDAVAAQLPARRDVVVRIAPGTYDDVQLEWSEANTMASNRIVFMPWVEGRDFGDDSFVTFERTDARPSRFFRLVKTTDADRATNLVFFHLRIRGYWQGIVLSGRNGVASGVDEPGAVTHNAIVDCRFENIGALFFPETVGHGYSAVGLNNADHTEVRFNWFTAIENRSADGPS